MTIAVWEVDGVWHDLGGVHCRCTGRCVECGGRLHGTGGYGFYVRQCEQCWRPDGKPYRMEFVSQFPGAE